MTIGLQPLSDEDLAKALEEALLPYLAGLLRARSAGHCMRVSDLDRVLMGRLAGRLAAEVPISLVVVLSDGRVLGNGIPPDVAVTGTKLVELRNPLPDGTLRPPLLVFVPNDLRASAEDSFSVATFEDVAVDGGYRTLVRALIQDCPADIRMPIAQLLGSLTNGEQAWVHADPIAIVRFLLTAKLNGFDREAIGAALFELGLVPDFEVLSPPERVVPRITRNRDCVRSITWSPKTERGRALDLGLKDRAFRKALGEYFAEVGVEDPKVWTRLIVTDRARWPLAFNRWEFEDGGANPDAIYIGDVTLVDLPVVKDDETDPRLAELIGQRVLPVGKDGLKKFSVSFRVDPIPSRVQGLKRFVAQVVSVDNGPIGLTRRKAAWAKATDTATIGFSSLRKVEWEEGWHFVRILAEAEDGELVPLVDDAGNPLSWSPEPSRDHSRPNESDLFYVLADEDIEVEPRQRAIPREVSVFHARLKAQFSALLQDRDPNGVQITSVGWAERKGSGKGSGTETIEVKLGREGTHHVLLSAQLAAMELQILSSSRGAISWNASISQGIVGPCTGDAGRWPDAEGSERFLEARARYFDAIRASDHLLVTQGADLLAMRQLALEYAENYVELIQGLGRRAETETGPGLNRLLSELRALLQVDTIRLVITDYRDRRREALLVAPTHPLRAIWYATWTAVAENWLSAAKSAPREFAVPTRDALLRNLAPASFPALVPVEGGHVLVPVDNLNPFWSLYAPTHERDPRGLVGDVCAAFGLAEPAIGGALLDGGYLATRLQRYLVQHPYVNTLTLNAFNCGRGAALAETLLAMQRARAFGGLRYDIRLFVPDPDAPGVGEALLELLNPEGSTTAHEADAFSTPTESHLRPKLRVAVRAMQEFRDDPELHVAHLSLLCDVFPTEDIRVAPTRPEDRGAAIFGLLQEFSVDYHEDDRTVAWLRRPRHGSATPVPGAEECSDVLASLAELMSEVTAVVATGQAGSSIRPVIALALSAEDRALLHQVHEVSDWVMTLDRNLGIEFFDHRRKRSRPDYLIDHSPDIANALGHRLVITSRSVTELEALFRPVLVQYGLNTSGRQSIVLLDQLRSLSGRLALKLISSPTQRAEALGLALSRLYLEHQGAFENQVVVPLDAHTDLYRVLKQQADELGDEVSFRRTDLALFDMDEARRVVTCRLVEVKCYAQTGDLLAYESLKASIAEQVSQSEKVIAYHFDPNLYPVDRPDRAMKNRELAAILDFYLRRSERYGLVASDAASEARYFLRTIYEKPYRLEFTRSALIFDFQKPGTESPDVEAGIEYHRIGRNLVQQLIDAAAPGTESTLPEVAVPVSDRTAPVTEELRRRRELASAVPTLETAAFIGKPRERTTSWDDVAGRSLGGSRTALDYPSGGSPSGESAESTHVASDSAGSLAAPASVEVETASEPVSAAPEVKSPAATADSVAPMIEAEGVAVVGDQPGAQYDVLLGVSDDSPQFGILAEASGRRVALDLNQTHTISLFGVQGGGKSYTLGAIAEMASLPIPGINRLPRPLATVIFHYSPTQDYRPEFTSMVQANRVDEQIAQLRVQYGATPANLADVLLLAPADKIELRREEYPDIQVHPLKFSAAELQTGHWRFLMGAVGNQATYIRQLTRIMRAMRNDLTLEGLRHGIDHAAMPDHLKEMARMRLDLAAEYIDDAYRLGDLIRPGRVVIVDLRDEFIEKDEALGLFVVMLQLFADATYQGQKFNKLVVFDEAHKYIESPDLVAGLVEVVREMRHKGVSIMVASQDPPSVPISLIELSSQVILHKFNSPAWLKHIQKANAALGALTPERMASLRAGEAYAWSSKATDESFVKGAVKIRCRPRVTQHGGATRTAVESPRYEDKQT